MSTQPNLVRIQEKGQVTLPASIRERLGLKKGDFVSIEETPHGVLIRPQTLIASDALERISTALQESGVSLEDLIESGRDKRDDLLQEFYGIAPASS